MSLVETLLADYGSLYGPHAVSFVLDLGLMGAVVNTIGLIETAEKAAEVYMKIAHLPLRQTITGEQLARHFGVRARAGWLD